MQDLQNNFSPNQEPNHSGNGIAGENSSVAETSSTQPAQNTHIVFIDSTVEDYQSLAAGVEPGTEVVILDSTRDAVGQITEVLANRSDINSVHIVSHGGEGSLQLGLTGLNAGNLEAYSSQLQQWKSALTPDADILLYGCNVASGQTGEAFIQKLIQLTGADVAASNDMTGSAAKGGDWDLEVATGNIEAPLAFQSEVMQTYNSILPTTRVSVNSSGTQGNSYSQSPSISGNGRYVVFQSGSNNLVSGDTNGTEDIFVRDTLTNTTTRVSVDSNGVQGNDTSFYSSISADGRYVAFSSRASNLVSDDTNGANDVFVRDTLNNTTTRISVDSMGNQGNGGEVPSISADGRYVAFMSEANNLVSGDTNGWSDIFVRDTLTNTTTRVSVDSTGIEGNFFSEFPSISADGRYVAFRSYADNLVSGDTNNAWDIFVRDTLTNTTIRVSVDSSGIEGNNSSSGASISNDGRYVAFMSDADNLVSDDTNGTPDIFVRDTLTNTTIRVSVDSMGNQTNGPSFYPSISADGRYVAFRSAADNLVSGDTNGTEDIFVHDRQTGTTTRVSVDSIGNQANGYSQSVSISASGHSVAFYSNASNLVSGDTNGWSDIFVFSSNTAPIIDNTGSPVLTAINEDNTTNAGTLVSAIVASGAGGNPITDADTGAVEGIAVIGVDNTNGTWQYSTNGGSSWNNFSVSPTSATLLRDTASDKIRFVPNANFNGTVTNGITFRAWDTTDGNPSGTTGADSSVAGGTSPFSSDTETASITVNPVNDAPSFIPGGNQSAIAGAGAQTVNNWATGFNRGNTYESNQTLLGYQIVSNTAPGIFSVAPTIDATGKLTYTPATSLGAGASATIGVVVKDNGGTANGGQDTSTIRYFDITVNPNIAPLNVVINEVAWMGTNADFNDEWIELYNPTANAIDLSGWTLTSADGTPSITFPTGKIIPSGGYFLLERTADTTVSNVTADLIYTGSLVNTGETLTLKAPDGVVIDTANGDGGPWTAGVNVTTPTTVRLTMERNNPIATETDAQWHRNDGVTRNGTDAGGNLIYGTPKAANSLPVAPGVTVTPITSTTTEAGGTASFAVKLDNVSSG